MQKGKSLRAVCVPNRPGCWETRIRYGGGRRKRLVIQHCRTEDSAIARVAEMVEIAEMLLEAGKKKELESILEAAAKAESLAKFTVVRNLARRVCSGVYDGSVQAKSKLPEGITLREFSVLWVDGELHRKWPDHVVFKKTAGDDAGRLRKHVLPVIGHLKVKDITLDDADSVMESLPRLSKASRRHVAQLLVRLMNLATYPARLITASPIPRGWLPKLGKKINYPILLSTEDAALMRETTVPLRRRLMYGILHREGLRRGDVEMLRWRQVNLEFGTLRIEDDKTGHSRMFRMDPGVVAGLRVWKDQIGVSNPDDFVLAEEDGLVANVDHLAEQLRGDLKSAGVTRAELFESHGQWKWFVAHTLRHSYVTRNLARGVPEDTVRQHTGHRSNELRRYREFANSIAELQLEDLVPLNEAIPEFAKVGHNVGHRVGQVEKRASPEPVVNTKNTNLIN